MARRRRHSRQLGMEVLERKFIQQYGSMTEREFWWFVDHTLRELTER